MLAKETTPVGTPFGRSSKAAVKMTTYRLLLSRPKRNKETACRWRGRQPHRGAEDERGGSADMGVMSSSLVP